MELPDHPAEPKEPATAHTPLFVTSLEHSIWIGLHTDLALSLNRLNLVHLSAPTMLILHDLLDSAVRTMQRKVFLKLVEEDFGMSLEDNEESLQGLYDAEVAEHGSQNIAQYCNKHGWHVTVNFPVEANIIVTLDVPVDWAMDDCSTLKLVEALGFQVDIAKITGAATGSVISLLKNASKAPTLHLGGLMEESASLKSVQNIYEKLGYGVIQISSAGEIIAVSSTMLTSAKLPVNEASVTRMCAAIPFNFYNDIIWGLALAGQSGVFENYRIRVRLEGDEKLSILYNVSGYRDEQSVIHSLWQIVSLADGGASLSEGSILSEVRIHKITRNYVPQLVEQKAREAVRMGKDNLSNEERFVAVLFCDIVGFTSYVESNSSSESIINTLNTILRRVSSSVKRFHGSIDKFMGDSVMAIFKDPADAIYAAQDMQSHSADINSLRSRAGQDMLRLRIGIHWGEVVIGNVGTPERLDWTAIGDVVNTASRIEKNCDPGSILVSEILRDAIDAALYPDIEFAAVFEIKVKGKRAALPVCHIKHPDDKSTG